MILPSSLSRPPRPPPPHPQRLQPKTQPTAKVVFFIFFFLFFFFIFFSETTIAAPLFFFLFLLLLFLAVRSVFKRPSYRLCFLFFSFSSFFCRERLEVLPISHPQVRLQTSHWRFFFFLFLY